MAIRSRWGLHAARVGNLADDLSETPMIWGARTPEFSASAAGKLKAVSLLEPSLNFHLGGRDRVEEFTYGPPLVGDLSQDGVYPRDPSLTTALIFLRSGQDPMNALPFEKRLHGY